MEKRVIDRFKIQRRANMGKDEDAGKFSITRCS